MRTLLFCLVTISLFAQDKAPKNIEWYKTQLNIIENKPADNFCQTFERFLEYKELQNKFLEAKLRNPIVETTLSSNVTIVRRRASALGVQEFRTKGEVSCIGVYGDRDLNHVIKPIMDLAMLQFIRENGKLTLEEKKIIDKILGQLAPRK